VLNHVHLVSVASTQVATHPPKQRLEKRKTEEKKAAGI